MNIALDIMEFVLMYSGFPALLISIITIYFAFRRNRREATLFEKEYFSNILSDIIEMKRWVLQSESIMKTLIEDTAVKDLLNNKLAENEEDLIHKCIFFFYLERIYYHLVYCKKISLDAENLGVELKMWLDIPESQKFFYGFCKPYKPYTKRFLNQVDNYYKEKNIGEKEAEDFLWR
uniref:DUF4760 domain-containing protein n=1 Tax=Candidatus Kentrum sp. FW TaxID=2126338 RepID=A0A450TV75_9GAMM|nr:MAG: hypothetical protein BECKFW1821C_GA0114237_103725 [Candidatus Kentron sp. FW]